MELVERDKLNRIAKVALDAGEVETMDEALELFGSYRFGVVVGDSLVNDRALQAALLTIANAGPRACHGGVTFSGATDLVLDVPWAKGRSVAEAVLALGCAVADELEPQPLVALGEVEVNGELVLYPHARGWCGGVTSGSAGPAESSALPIAGSLAGAIAVSEIFQHLRGNVLAGRRGTGLSLWRPELDWTQAAALGAPLRYLPTDFWLLGLGHLGQANAWTIALLPYPDFSEVTVMLQDRDVLADANQATSMLFEGGAVGELKTRLVSRRLEDLGFRTRLTERHFDAHQRVQDTEPTLALSGFDNAPARRVLCDAGFHLVVDSGLGGGPESYLDLMLHTFPASRRSADIESWKSEPKSTEALVEAVAGYQKLIRETGDPCGVLEIAGASVATAFVGCVAAALSVAEACRSVTGGPRYEVIDLSLRNPSRVRVAPLADAAPFAGRYIEL